MNFSLYASHVGFCSDNHPWSKANKHSGNYSGFVESKCQKMLSLFQNF